MMQPRWIVVGAVLLLVALGCGWWLLRPKHTPWQPITPVALIDAPGWSELAVEHLPQQHSIRFTAGRLASVKRSFTTLANRPLVLTEKRSRPTRTPGIIAHRVIGCDRLPDSLLAPLWDNALKTHAVKAVGGQFPQLYDPLIKRSGARTACLRLKDGGFHSVSAVDAVALDGQNRQTFRLVPQYLPSFPVAEIKLSAATTEPYVDSIGEPDSAREEEYAALLLPDTYRYYLIAEESARSSYSWLIHWIAGKSNWQPSSSGPYIEDVFRIYENPAYAATKP